MREIRGTLVVRDLERGRNTLIVQALDRLTLRLNAEGEEDSRQVSLFAVDWTHQLENGVTLSTKVALRQRLREWQMSGGDEASYGMQALLYQLSANVPVAERAAVEVFGRQIVDSAGGSVGGGAVELLYDLTPDVAIGLGVSNFGGTDPDFAHLVPPWSEGVYMRLQVKY